METEKELKQLKELLLTKVSRNPDKRYQRENRNSRIYKNYALSEKTGKRVYESFSDEELKQYLRGLAETLNHAPAQKEVFWVLRDYIKQRFGKWPYALREAGLTSAAGRGGKSLEQIKSELQQKEQFLEQVREKAIEMGKIPHPKDMPQVCEALRKYYSQWGEVLTAAGLDSSFLNQKCTCLIEDLEPEYRQMLEEIRKQAYERGRSPAHGEIDPKVKEKLISRCGSLRNALYQIGLEPVSRVKPFYGIYIDHRKAGNRSRHTESLHNCVYKVLRLTEEEEKGLQQLAELQKEKGRVLLKDDVPDKLRRLLQKSCGSWVNVLYQIGTAPEEYYKTLKEVKQNEK